jgi:hypothetical protein
MKATRIEKVRCLMVSALVFSLPLVATSAQQPETSTRRLNRARLLDQHEFLKVNGTARLIIGLYELPEDDAKLQEIAESGFNLVRVPQDVKALDRIQKHNLWGWICLGSTANLPEDDQKAESRLAQLVNRFKDHPALLVWELPDEAVWNIWWSRFNWFFSAQSNDLRKHIEKAKATQSDAGKWFSLLQKAQDYSQRGLWRQAEDIYDTLWTGLQVENPHPAWKMSTCPAEADQLTEAVSRGCGLIKDLDPRHIIWQNHAPRNSIARLRQYNKMVDAAGCDIYPVPFNHGAGHSDLKDTNLTSVGAYTDRMRQAAPGKAIWMVLQGFGWRDLNKDSHDQDPEKGRRPNYHETRFMAYDAIVHGANAILYWGTHYIEKDSTLWQDLMRITRELRALEPAVVGQVPQPQPTSTADETYGSIDGQGPRLMLRKTNEDWVLTAVNEHSQGISFTVNGLPGELNGQVLYRLYSDETHTPRNATIRDGISGFGVHIYATSRRFEAH